MGSSVVELEKLLPSLIGKRIFFYLDAHWEKYWPLRDELEEISRTHKDNCVIFIDDVLVPGYAEVNYDLYKGAALSFDYIKDKVEKVFTDYTVHYVINGEWSTRA